MAVMTEELWIQLLEREADKAKRDRVTKAQSTVKALHDQMMKSCCDGTTRMMLKSYYGGFTAEELEGVASAMQSAIASRDLRNVSRSSD